jgi:hypothetical protein
MGRWLYHLDFLSSLTLLLKGVVDGMVCHTIVGAVIMLIYIRHEAITQEAEAVEIQQNRIPSEAIQPPRPDFVKNTTNYSHAIIGRLTVTALSAHMKMLTVPEVYFSYTNT